VRKGLQGTHSVREEVGRRSIVPKYVGTRTSEMAVGVWWKSRVDGRMELTGVKVGGGG